ncbi:unnamed protein product [Brachionus calyciflorus]|uniref:EF-hand domain-containing protein n=1 Tax=Brachionus calyciflorus TaxID=104777 RepID=A0A814I5Y9_9BILA|nr:unnamed protein product [Brachionus calyciflorus]
MSYFEFRNVAGADNLIDFNEFLQVTRQKYPYLDMNSVYEIARDKFALMDRDRNGRISYDEFADAAFRNFTSPLNYQQPYLSGMYGPFLPTFNFQPHGLNPYMSPLPFSHRFGYPFQRTFLF